MLDEPAMDLPPIRADSSSSGAVLAFMRGMGYMPGMGLGRHQQGALRVIWVPAHNLPFGLGYQPTPADHDYMERLQKVRSRATMIIWSASRRRGLEP